MSVSDCWPVTTTQDADNGLSLAGGGKKVDGIIAYSEGREKLRIYSNKYGQPLVLSDMERQRPWTTTRTVLE